MSSNARVWIVACVVGAVLGAAITWFWQSVVTDGEAGPPPATPAPTVTVSPPPAAEPAVDEESPGTSVIPSALQGTWCTGSGDDPLGGTGDPCFSFADLLAEYPGMTLDQDGDVDGVTPDGVLRFTSCLGLDLEPAGCSMAASMFFELYPVGVARDCATAAAELGLPGCDPDFTAAHDVSRARLVIVPNHQQGDLYYDTEPMYRQP